MTPSPRMVEAVQVEQRLRKAQDAAKVLLGEKYDKEMLEIGEILKKVVAETTKTVLEAAIMMATDAEKNGLPMLGLMLLSAACELIEKDDSK